MGCHRILLDVPHEGIPPTIRDLKRDPCLCVYDLSFYFLSGITALPKKRPLLNKEYPKSKTDNKATTMRFPGLFDRCGPQYRTREVGSDDPNLSMMPDGSYHYSRRPRTQLEAHRIRQEAFSNGRNWARAEARRRGMDDDEPGWEWDGAILNRRDPYGHPARAWNMRETRRGQNRVSRALSNDMMYRDGRWNTQRGHYFSTRPDTRQMRRGWW